MVSRLSRAEKRTLQDIDDFVANRRRKRMRMAALVIVAMALMSGVGASLFPPGRGLEQIPITPTTPGTPATPSTPTIQSTSTAFDQLVVVLMENHDIGDIY